MDESIKKFHHIVTVALAELMQLVMAAVAKRDAAFEAKGVWRSAEMFEDHPIPEGMIDKLKAFATTLGFTVVEGGITGRIDDKNIHPPRVAGVRGETDLDAKEIRLLSEMDPAWKFYILAHEIGHVLHNPEPVKVTGTQLLDYLSATRRGVMPLVIQEGEAHAELTNFFVRRALGMPTGIVGGYLVGSGIKPMIVAAASDVAYQNARKILQYLSPEVLENDEAEIAKAKAELPRVMEYVNGLGDAINKQEQEAA